METINLEKWHIEKINAVNEALKGTQKYGMMYMETYVKGSNSRWIFMGYGVPMMNDNTVVKSFKDKHYICQFDGNGIEHRYLISQNVADLFGWKI